MKLRIVPIVAALLLSGPAMAKKKEPAQCVVYFTAVENDTITRGVDLQWLNRPQTKWYEKHGDNGKFSGICYSKDLSDIAALPATTPVYEILWGEEPFTYNYSYTTTQTATGTATDANGNTSTTETQVPVTHVGTGRSYHGNALLLVWEPGQKKFIPVNAADSAMGVGKALGKAELAAFTFGLAGRSSASARLLENAMEQIKEREKERLVPMQIPKGATLAEPKKP